jgi:hypothetical protein
MMKEVKKVLVFVSLVLFCIVIRSNKLHADPQVPQSNEVSANQSELSAGQEQLHQKNRVNELCQVEVQSPQESESGDLQLQNIASQLQKLNILEKENNELSLLVDKLQKHVDVIEKNMADFEHNIGRVSQESEHLCNILPDYQVIDNLQSRVSSLDNQFSSLEVAVNTLENQVGGFEASPPCTPLCAPCPVETCSCWLGTLQYLYWTVTENYLDYAIQGVPTTPSPTPSGPGQLGSIQSARFDWRSGFRVGLQHNNCDRFETELEYTYFHDHGHHSLTPNPNTFTDATFLAVSASTPAITFTGSVRTKIAFDYNMAHLLLAKSILLTNYFSLRAQAGLVGGVITQDWRISYFGAPAGAASTFVTTDWKFYGAGLKGGANFEWVLWRKLTLLSKMNLSLIYGAYKNRINNFVVNNISATTNPSGQPYSLFNAHLFDHRFVTSIQFSLGPTYSWNWRSHECSVFVFYEINTLTNLQETYRSTEAGLVSSKDSNYTPGHITLHGVTVGLSFWY